MKRNYNGEGTVFFSASLNRYVAQYTDPITHKRKSIYDKSEKQVRKKLRTALNKVEKGIHLNKNSLTIPEVALKYIENKHNANITGSSAYLRELNSLNIIKDSTISDIPIQLITKEELQGFLNSIKHYSNSYISKIYELIKVSYNQAIEDDIVLKMPKVIKPKSDKQDKKVEAFTLDQHREFLKRLENEPQKDIFLVGINTGLRIGEILALESTDIDLKCKVIHVNKTISRNEYNAYEVKKSTKTYAGMRDVPFDDYMADIFKKLVKTKGLLFTSDGKLLRPTSINATFKRICKGMGDVNFHMLRHTFATRCIEAGMPPHVLQKLLGHSDVSITINTYTSIFDKYKQDEFDKLIKYMKSNKLH